MAAEHMMTNMIGTISSVQGEGLIVRVSGERTQAHEGNPVFDGDVVVASNHHSSILVNVSQADVSGVVGIYGNEMAQVSTQLIQNTSFMFSDQPLSVGTPINENIIPLFQDAVVVNNSEYAFHDSVSLSDEVMVITPFTSTNMLDNTADTFIWNENYEAVPYFTLTGTALATDTQDHGGEPHESITLQLADITGITDETLSMGTPGNTQLSDGVLKLGDLLDGSVSTAMEAANYVHIVSDTATNSGLSGLYVSKDSILTDESRETINTLFADKVVASHEAQSTAEKSIADITGFTDSASQQGVADQLQALMDMGFLEI